MTEEYPRARWLPDSTRGEAEREAISTPPSLFGDATKHNEEWKVRESSLSRDWNDDVVVSDEVANNLE